MIAENGLWFCNSCKEQLIEHESWFLEIDKEHLCVCCAEKEIVKLRKAITQHRWEMREYRGAFYDEALWAAIGPLPGGEK